MDNHPIPQDVTGFQFRLVGSLTLKQFGYLGASVVLVLIIYYLPAVALYVKIPLIIIFGGIGPALAFLPIEGRPLDQMASHFVHALITPNQYLFIKAGGKLPLSMIELKSVRQLNEKQLAEKRASEEKLTQKEDKLNIYLQQIHQSSSNVDKREDTFMQNVLGGQPIQPAPTVQVAPPPPATIQNTMPQQVATPIAVPTPAPIVEAPVVGVTPDAAPKASVPTLPENPNLILGVLKDSRGNPLPHMLVEIKDKDQNPVRAFKTNLLGQFAAATPLPNGTYTIVFEDPKAEHSFDVVQITADGGIIPTIEVISHDAREALRQQLFG